MTDYNSSVQERVSVLLTDAVESGVFPGAVAGVIHADGSRLILPAGCFKTDGRPMFGDAVFDVASITKSIPTSSLGLRLLERGMIRLDDRVRTYIPEIRHSHADAMLIRHLFTQTIDYGFALSAYKDCPASEILDAIFTRELARTPGSSFFYSNATSVLLGLIVERVSGKKLDVLAQDMFFGPLGMNRTTFHPEMFDHDDVVPTEIDSWRGREICGEVHDESAWKLREIMIAGSAGLFSAVPDILLFLHMLLNGGTANGHRFLDTGTVDAIFTNQISGIGQSAGLGWELNQERYMGNPGSEVIGKTGFTGCSVVCCREKKTAAVLLSNYTYPQRKTNADIINAVRRRFTEIAIF